MTNRKVFIQANKSQRLGALLSRYSITRFTPDISVEILQVEEIPAFKTFEGKTYFQGSEERTYSLSDEQSFTLTRFMPPQLMGYRGRAIVIDPDVFAVQDISPLFEMNLEDKPVACCSREGKFWDTSVMLLENEKLEWNIEKILGNLNAKEVNYNTVMRKLFGLPIKEIPRTWNSLDKLTPETRMIHYTRQRTQPWKTGLPFTVTPRKLGKFLGFIPREWILSERKKYPATYQEHPNKEAEHFFFDLLQSALKAGAITKEQVEAERDRGNIRQDIFSYAAI